MGCVKRSVHLAVAVGLLSGCSVSPQYISSQEIIESALNDRTLIYHQQEALAAPLSLEEAMARAVKYNLESRVKLMEKALAFGNFKMAQRDMLPSLATSAGYYHRNNTLASVSRSILTGAESLEPSTSQDEERNSADVRFGWNALDFGVSYLQAQQEADRYIIAEMTRKNVMLKMLQQVRSAYWRTASLQSIEQDVQLLLTRARGSLQRLEGTRSGGLSNPIDVLKKQRALIEIIQKLEQMQQQINASQVELASLINVDPRVDVAVSVDSPLRLPEPPDDFARLERAALANSSLYTTQLYNLRIDQRESRKNLIRMLPSIDFGYGYNYDSNSYLVNNAWGQASLSISWNILRLLSAGQLHEQESARKELALARRMAVNMATVAKVHLSWQDYANSLNRITRSTELDDINQELSRLSRQASAYDAGNDIELIQTEMRALSSHIEKQLNYASAQEAYGGFLLSLGLNPIPDNYQQFSVSALGDVIAKSLLQWREGTFLKHAEEEPSNKPADDTSLEQG